MHSLFIKHNTVVTKSKRILKTCHCEGQKFKHLSSQTKRQSPILQINCPLASRCLIPSQPLTTYASSFLEINSRVLFKLCHNYCTNVLNNSHNNYNNAPITTTLVLVRNIHVTPLFNDKEPLKPSSKLEETVTALKEKEDKVVPAAVEKKAVVPKKPIGQKIKEELLHYYHGFRLLFIDINVSRKLLWKVLNGHSLSRREHKLLVRTVADLFRLVPFSVFIVVPFMEFLLPFFIKFFPGMLPSTFQTATEREDKMKQALKVKLEMAKFLQKTLDDMAVQGKGHSSQGAKEFSAFFDKIRTTGEDATIEEILKFSKLFEDEITLDSLSRPQLTALCRVLEIQPLGTTNFLRFQLRTRLRSLAADDKVIHKEGIESLTPIELQQACRARGMRAYGMSEIKLRHQLAQWLDLSLNEKVPPSLLLLSRALLLPDTISTGDQLKATISALPDAVATQTKAAISEREGQIDNKMKIEVIKEEERKIQEESRERKEEEKRREQIEKKEILQDKAPILTVKSKPDLVAPHLVVAKGKEEISTEDLEKLEDALESLSMKEKLYVEKEELHDLKEEMAEYQEDVADLHKVLSKTPEKPVKETKAAQRLFKKVGKMISNMDAVLEELEKEKAAIESKRSLKDPTTRSEQLVSIDELMDAIKQIQKVPDASLEERISEVLEKMDDDHDGSIKVEDVLKVIELVGKENVKLNAKQVDEILVLLDKEELIDLESQIEKALEQDTRVKVPIESTSTVSTKLDEAKKQPASPPQKKASATETSQIAMAAAPPKKPNEVAEPKDNNSSQKL